MTPPSLESALLESRVLVCAGTGGVGKTTIAAALAIQAAIRGRRTLVLTIDPARRLADALGLASLDSKPVSVDLAALEAEGVDDEPDSFEAEGMGDEPDSFEAEGMGDEPDSFEAEGMGDEPGSLDAMMLDAKPTFDRLIHRLTEDDEERRRILENRIYQHLSSALAGSAEYAAMEQVHELVHSGRYDLIVVDTPPSDHALDFLRAPRRLREFLESRFVKTLVRPAMSASRIGFRLFGRPLHRMLTLLEKIAGVGFLDDLTEFLSAIDGLSQGFQDRATRVEEVLTGRETGFVLVSSANRGANQSTLEFMSALDEFRVSLVAVVVNRLRPWPVDATPEELVERCGSEALARDESRLAEAFAAAGDSGDVARRAARVSESVLESAQIRAIEDRTVAALDAAVAERSLRCLTVPELGGDVDRLDGLMTIGGVLCSGGADDVTEEPA